MYEFDSPIKLVSSSDSYPWDDQFESQSGNLLILTDFYMKLLAPWRPTPRQHHIWRHGNFIRDSLQSIDHCSSCIWLHWVTDTIVKCTISELNECTRWFWMAHSYFFTRSHVCKNLKSWSFPITFPASNLIFLSVFFDFCSPRCFNFLRGMFPSHRLLLYFSCPPRNLRANLWFFIPCAVLPLSSHSILSRTDFIFPSS
jgi:hypothetical protein